MIVAAELLDHRVELPGQDVDFVVAVRLEAFAQIALLHAFHCLQHQLHAVGDRIREHPRQEHAQHDGEHHDVSRVFAEAGDGFGLLLGMADDVHAPLISQRADHQARHDHGQGEADVQPAMQPAGGQFVEGNRNALIDQVRGDGP